MSRGKKGPAPLGEQALAQKVSSNPDYHSSRHPDAAIAGFGMSPYLLIFPEGVFHGSQRAATGFNVVAAHSDYSFVY
jgi:hypothetical protein